jgi:hypothetical protein
MMATTPNPDRVIPNMKIVNLPKWLEPVSEFDLVRLGRDRDGGYLVDSRDVAEADVLISLGVNDDWSFEEDFLEYRRIPLHAFDGTVDRRILAKRLIKAAASGKDVKHKFKAWREYRKFFTESRHHHTEMVGLDDTPGFVTLRGILNEHAHGKVFLKIDVEGWEYRLLDDILAEAHRICGLVVEFHNVDLHHALLEDFVGRLPLCVAHVHLNSYAPISDQGVPLVLEVTFSSHAPVTTTTVKLPHSLDRLSAPHHEPSEVRFTG